MVRKSQRQILDEDDLPVGMRSCTLDELRLEAPVSDTPLYPKGEQCGWCGTILSQHNPMNVCLRCLTAEVVWQRILRDIRGVKPLRVDDAKTKKEAPEGHTLVAYAMKALKIKMRKALPPSLEKARWHLPRSIPGEMDPDDWAWSSLLHPVQ